MTYSTDNQHFKILIWIEHHDHFLVSSTKNGEKHLLEVQPNYAETTLEAIERYGNEILDLNFESVELIDIIEQTSIDHLEQNDTIFLYQAKINPKEILPKLTHSQIIFWLPIEKAASMFSVNFLSKITKNGK